ncbi:MAG: hypothetical protein WEB13_10155 [Dehalococcoidia bacterium]
MVLPHLQTLAPTLTLGGGHFDVNRMDHAERDFPELFTIQLRDVPVGAIDFLPLPAGRTLMRLYLCSDLGTTCQLEDGDQIATGFVEVWLNRLQRLGFLAVSAPPTRQPHRRLGFVTPADRELA